MKNTITHAILGFSLALTLGASQPAHAEFFPERPGETPAAHTQQSAEPAADAQQSQQSGSNEESRPASAQKQTTHAPCASVVEWQDANWTSPLNSDHFSPMR